MQCQQVLVAELTLDYDLQSNIKVYVETSRTTSVGLSYDKVQFSFDHRNEQASGNASILAEAQGKTIKIYGSIIMFPEGKILRTDPTPQTIDQLVKVFNLGHVTQITASLSSTQVQRATSLLQ